MAWFGWRRRRAGRIRDLEAAPDALIAGRVRAVGVPYMLPRDLVSVQKSLGGPYVVAGLTTDDEFTETLATAQADLDSPQYRCVAPWYISVGQRSRVG